MPVTCGCWCNILILCKVTFYLIGMNQLLCVISLHHLHVTYSSGRLKLEQQQDVSYAHYIHFIQETLQIWLALT